MLGKLLQVLCDPPSGLFNDNVKVEYSGTQQQKIPVHELRAKWLVFNGARKKAPQKVCW